METMVLTSEDADRYKAIRLDALHTDPSAFGTTLEKAEGYDDATWQARVASYKGGPGAVFVVPGPDGADQGMVGIGLEDDGVTATLWGMWVRPDARGTGAASALISATVAWATEHGAHSIVLWVVRTNGRAIATYERADFVVDEEIVASPWNPCGDELAMRRRL